MAFALAVVDNHPALLDRQGSAMTPAEFPLTLKLIKVGANRELGDAELLRKVRDENLRLLLESLDNLLFSLFWKELVFCHFISPNSCQTSSY